eukprot:gene6868-161_t
MKSLFFCVLHGVGHASAVKRENEGKGKTKKAKKRPPLVQVRTSEVQPKEEAECKPPFAPIYRRVRPTFADAWWNLQHKNGTAEASNTLFDLDSVPRIAP